MSSTATVSIVLPNYNYAHYLDERIQSLLHQTYTDFELIILDDASTDDSLTVIDKYTDDPRVRTTFFAENSGSPFRRWNDGAKLARGHYLLIAEADDSCHPTLLQKLVGKLDMHSSVGLAYCQSLSIDGDGNRIGTWKSYTDALNTERWANDYVDKGQTELSYLLFRNTIPNASAVLMRRNLFMEVGMADPTLRVIGDWMLWWKMLMVSDVAFVAEPLNYFRTHLGSVRGRAFEQRLVQFDEEFRGLRQRLESMEFSADKLEEACDDITSRWVKAVLHESAVKQWRTNLRIYRIGRGFDPKIRQRLARQLTRQLLKQLRKKLRRTGGRVR